jgi:protein-S-isoprenylcysteine O-methyltransferase Ste14
MSLLHELRAAPVPRPAKLQRRVARRIDGISGFVAYGVLYLFVVANTLTLAVTLGGMVLINHTVPHDAPPWFSVTVGIAFAAAVIAAFVASWLPFVWWMRRRQRPGRELARDGAFVDGRVVGWRRTSRNAYVTIELAGGVHITNLMVPWLSEAGFPEGTPVTALYAPGNRYALYFTPSGQGVGAAVDTRGIGVRTM